jgi:hypothetical protein
MAEESATDTCPDVRSTIFPEHSKKKKAVGFGCGRVGFVDRRNRDQARNGLETGKYRLHVLCVHSSLPRWGR